MHIDLRDLVLFNLIAETKILTKAAERNHLSLSAVSTLIKDFELHAGVRLLYRTPGGVALTPAGQSLLRHARTILGEIGHMKSELQRYREDVQGSIRYSPTRPPSPSSCRKSSRPSWPRIQMSTSTCKNAPPRRSSAVC